eukprot:6852433-Prymnesium_polylepis.1
MATLAMPASPICGNLLPTPRRSCEPCDHERAAEAGSQTRARSPLVSSPLTSAPASPRTTRRRTRLRRSRTTLLAVAR